MRLLVPANIPAQQLEFPERCKRSCEGAVYLQPNSILTLTDDEYEYLVKADASLVKRLSVVKDGASLRSRLQPRAAENAQIRAKLKLEDLADKHRKAPEKTPETDRDRQLQRKADQRAAEAAAQVSSTERRPRASTRELPQSTEKKPALVSHQSGKSKK